MKKVLALAMVLAGSGAVFAQGSAVYTSALSGARALGLPAAASQALEAEAPALPAPVNVIKHPHPYVLPEDCKNMPVLYVQDGYLFANGEKLGDRPSQYKGACNGETAWTDTSGTLYRGKAVLGRAQNFELALYTGDVFWKDNYGTLMKNKAEIGRAQSFKVSDYTGSVAWTDNYGALYKDGRELGRSSNYQITGHTGDVVWQDNYGTLYKNDAELGRASRYMVADRTGDVAWTDN
nr:hypothetical protein [Elusimicrobiota bacterium]